MNTILVKNSKTYRFDLCDSTIAEADFEETVLWVFGEMFPDCLAIPFKPLVEYDGTRWRPDIALIDKKCRYWFVVEVETINHSLQKHVLPQVTAFKRGVYTQEATNLIASALNVSPDQAATFIEYVPRYVAVLANAQNAEWESRLAAEKVQFMSISAYAGVPDKQTLLVHGDLLAGEQSLGFGNVRATDQAIVCACNGFWTEKEYKITDETGTSIWGCRIAGNTAWLTKTRGLIDLEDGTILRFLLQGTEIVARRL